MVDDKSRFCSEPPLITMECSAPPSGPKIREGVGSSGKDISEVKDPSIDSEPEVLLPGMWQYPTNLEDFCIYRVPNRLRDVNPEAYTPQLLLIGPLHLSLKEQALMSPTDKGYTKFIGYLNMERHKKKYLKDFSERKEFNDENVINGFKRVIEENEMKIRASYSESTTRIKSHDFVDMILHDSVFILELVLRSVNNVVKSSKKTVKARRRKKTVEATSSKKPVEARSSKKTGDVVMDEPTIYNTVHEDLILLENQLPYFILEKIFDPIVSKLRPYNKETFRELIIEHFDFEGKIKQESKFRHFTDLFRRVRVETLKLEKEVDLTSKCEPIRYNAEKLENAGVKFEKIDEEGLSLEVKFEKGCLKLPCFHVDDSEEMRLRNIMALEQCHYPYQAYVCNFVIFLDYLIDTHKDVDLLVGKGIINNSIGYHGYVSDMVNKLSFGVVDFGSNYSKAATDVNEYYESPINKARALLKRVYFSDPWTGTATVAAVVLLLMTLIQTVASVI